MGIDLGRWSVMTAAVQRPGKRPGRPGNRWDIMQMGKKELYEEAGYNRSWRRKRALLKQAGTDPSDMPDQYMREMSIVDESGFRFCGLSLDHLTWCRTACYVGAVTFHLPLPQGRPLHV